MPRAITPPYAYVLPVDYIAVPGQPITSASHNDPLVDLQSTLNQTLPIQYGGTGGSSVITNWDGIGTGGAVVPSATAITLDTATGPWVDISGTTTVATIVLGSGKLRLVRATGAFQITASATLVVNGSASINYTTKAGDLLMVEGYASEVDVWTVGFGGGVAGASVNPVANTLALRSSTGGLAATFFSATANNPTVGGSTFLSGGSTLFSALNLGRTAAELTVAVPGASGQFFTNAAAGDVTFSYGSGSLRFGTGNIGAGGTEYLTLSNAGLLSVLAGQIAFPATENPSSGANVLDDYEEGTWGAAIGASTGTISSASVTAALYRKVGSFIATLFDFTIATNGTGAGQNTISHPFTASSSYSSGSFYQNTPTAFTGAVVVFDTSKAGLVKYDATYPGANGNHFFGGYQYFGS